MQVQSLSWEDPLEQEMAMCSSVLAWESHGQRSLVATIHAESNMTEQLSTHMRAHTHAHAHTHTRTHTHTHTHIYPMGFPGSSVHKEPACNAGDPGSIPGLRRSPREGIGYPL